MRTFFFIVCGVEFSHVTDCRVFWEILKNILGRHCLEEALEVPKFNFLYRKNIPKKYINKSLKKRV